MDLVNGFGECMKIGKIVVLSFILIILSVSCVNASDLGINDDLNQDLVNVQDNDVADLEISDNINQDLDIGMSPNEDNEISEDLRSNVNFNEGNRLMDDSTTVHKVSPTTYSNYFNRDGYVLTTAVSPGDTIDLSGRFSKKNFIFTMPCSITSSQNDAYLTNCMVEFENVTSDSSLVSSVSNLKFNTSIEKAPCVYILGSSYVDVHNCNAYSTGANSNPTLLVGSTYCNVHDNVFETTFTGYMNMSWKRAGILLGESHYNNIYSNFVTVKDSNGIYLTTYGFEKSNYNRIFNNTITTSAFSDETGLRNPSAWAYGIHLMGDYNLALNNTIMNTYRGVDSEGSFNEIIGNSIFNLSGSYYEGNNGTDGGEGGIFASYNNVIINNTIYDSKITGPAIYAVVNTTVCGNAIRNITGPNGIQFALTASNCLIYNNTISMNEGNAIIVKGNMSNLTLSNNLISTNNGSGILIVKQTRTKFPVDVTIVNNCFLENLTDTINYSDVEGKTIINLANNTVVVTNQTFFNFFSSDGSFSSSRLFENFILKGEFSDLAYSEVSELVKAISLNGKVTIIGDNAIIKDISFNINSNNVNIDNISVNITGASANAFNFNNANNSNLTNSIIYFNSTDESLVPIFADNSKISLKNNTIIAYGENALLVLNNTYCNLLDNILKSSSLNHEAILNDNSSYLLFGENEINSLADPAIVTINGAIIKYAFFIIEDSNYHEYFNPDGSFLDDVIFNFGDTIRIGNVNNKTFRFDIPLVIVGQKGTVMNNSLIILEGESSNSIIANFTFWMADYEYSGDISVITVKDGVSGLNISNNQFNIMNLTGDYASLNAIKIKATDISSSNVLIECNIINVDSNLSKINGISIMDDGIMAYDEIVQNMQIINNSISMINNRADGSANGISLSSALDSFIFNNSIYVKAYFTNGILAQKSNLTILNNSISVDGFNYERILDHIADNNLRELIEDGQIKADCAISVDKSTTLNDDVFDENLLIENNGRTNIIHYSSNDLENIIKNAEDGAFINLGNNVYIISNAIDINKTLSVSNGILVSNLKDKNVIFNVLASDDSTGKSIEISQSTIILDNADVFMAVDSLDDNDSAVIDVPSISIVGNDFRAISDDVVPESITILKLLSYKEVLNTNNNISISSNMIACGMRPFKFDVRTVFNGSDILISNSSIFEKTSTKIIYKDMVTTAVDLSLDGRVGKYFNATLTDDNGNPLAGKLVQIGLNGKIYNDTTDSNGLCQLQVNLGSGVYTFAVSFLGDENYKASFAVARITVNKQKPVISCSNYYFKASAKSKKVSISLKSASRKPLRNRIVQLFLNGKLYSGKTNSKGVATINISISKKKTYSFTVKYGGDYIYGTVSKKAKLVIS